MINLSATVKAQIVFYALQKDPQESCGFIVNCSGKNIFYPVDNIHQDPQNNVAIAAHEFIKAGSIGEIVATFHSHTNSNVVNGKLVFSDYDKAAAEALNLPCVLLSLPHQHFSFYEPCGYKSPLIGRSFIPGVHDCYTLVKDYFLELDIILNDYPMACKSEMNLKGWNRFEENFRKEDFLVVPLNSIRLHDVVMMKLESPFIDHIGVISDLSQTTKFIHQLLGEESTEQEWIGYWKRKTVKLIRHKSLCDGL